MPDVKDEKAAKILGNKMRRLRKLVGVTQADVEYALGYKSNGSISNVEKGLMYMSMDKIYKAADYFKVPPIVLMTPRDMTDKEIEMFMELERILRDNPNSPHVDSIFALMKATPSE
jgi:transcriptional regulator with XRE-family HTH domain